MSIYTARQIGKTWEKRLGLGAWKIKYKWGVHTEEYGTANFDICHRIAMISLNKQTHLPKEITVEYVIVHELLHLVLIELEIVEKAKTDQKELALERTINQLTNALLERHTHG
jgi:Zn-dependent peptidase ImmA (M78 family)